MLQLNQRQLDHFNMVKNSFYEKTSFPKSNNWVNFTNNDIWLRVVTQVMVVGSSSPYEKFFHNERLKQEINYESLLLIKNELEIGKKINQVLLSVGTRYA